MVPHGDGLRLTKVTDLQIVNGGQTTATLASALADREARLAHTFVQMKLSEVTAETNGKYTPLIARYANSQNKVSDADFYSNQEFHQRIEEISRLLRAPALGGAQYGTHWRYERARGTYMNEQAKLTPAQRKLFQLQNPRNQLITKVDLAKFENAWRFLPDIVSQGAQKNFVAFSAYAQAECEKTPEQFNEEYYKRVVVKAMLFWKTEELVSKQPWYQGGYRANVVAYRSWDRQSSSRLGAARAGKVPATSDPSSWGFQAVSASHWPSGYRHAAAAAADIHSITERHSLSPASFTRCPQQRALQRRLPPKRRNNGLTLFHLNDTNDVSLRLHTDSLCVRVLHTIRWMHPAALPFG